MNNSYCKANKLNILAVTVSVFVLLVLPTKNWGAENRPSAHLCYNIIADYFIRYFCSSHFPELKKEIEDAFLASSFSKFIISCNGLECSDPSLTRDFKKLWQDSSELSNGEAKELCKDYKTTLMNSERKYADELKRFSPNTKLP